MAKTYLALTKLDVDLIAALLEKERIRLDGESQQEAADGRLFGEKWLDGIYGHIDAENLRQRLQAAVERLDKKERAA